MTKAPIECRVLFHLDFDSRLLATVKLRSEKILNLPAWAHKKTQIRQCPSALQPLIFCYSISIYAKKIHKSPNHVFSLYHPSQNFNLLRSSISPYPSLAQRKRRQNQNYSRERGREPPNLSNDGGYVLFPDCCRGTYQPPDSPQCILGSTVLL